MKNYLYLTTVIIGSSMVIVNTMSWAQCVSTQDCTALGYTESSCSGENGGVKCPFGDKWACYPEPDNPVSCEVGTLYYSDGKCYDEYIDFKKLLGIVIYSNGASGGGWVMTVKPIQTRIAWDTGSYYSTGITDKAVSASCTNTQKLVAKGSRFAAANAANNYKPTGTPSGKKWCLPSYDLLNNLNNSVNFAKVNAGISTAGGTKLGYGGQTSYSYEYVWSSSECSDYGACTFYADTSGSFHMANYYKRSTNSYDVVRPVMEF